MLADVGHVVVVDDDLSLRQMVIRLWIPKTLSVLMMPRNHLSWRNDQAVLFRSGRPGLAIQVEGAA
jgi:hypothetical protein